jgi:hypothetical protein
MDDRRRMPSYGKSSPCLWQGELKMVNFKIEHGNHFLWRHIEWLIGTK